MSAIPGTPSDTSIRGAPARPSKGGATKAGSAATMQFPKEAEALPGPLQAYWNSVVLPLVQQGVVSLAQNQPDDPVDSLAADLFAKAKDVPSVEKFAEAEAKK